MMVGLPRWKASVFWSPTGASALKARGRLSDWAWPKWRSFPFPGRRQRTSLENQQFGPFVARCQGAGGVRIRPNTNRKFFPPQMRCHWPLSVASSYFMEEESSCSRSPRELELGHAKLWLTKMALALICFRLKQVVECLPSWVKGRACIGMWKPATMRN